MLEFLRDNLHVLTNKTNIITPASNDSLENTKDMIQLTETLKGKIEAKAIDFYENSTVLLSDALWLLSIGAELALESAWVSVKDALPEDPQAVLAYDTMEASFFVCLYNKYGFWDECDHGTRTKIVTHWRELPSPPNTTP